MSEVLFRNVMQPKQKPLTLGKWKEYAKLRSASVYPLPTDKYHLLINDNRTNRTIAELIRVTN